MCLFVVERCANPGCRYVGPEGFGNANPCEEEDNSTHRNHYISFLRHGECPQCHLDHSPSAYREVYNGFGVGVLPLTPDDRSPSLSEPSLQPAVLDFATDGNYPHVIRLLNSPASSIGSLTAVERAAQQCSVSQSSESLFTFYFVPEIADQDACSPASTPAAPDFSAFLDTSSPQGSAHEGNNTGSDQFIEDTTQSALIDFSDLEVDPITHHLPPPPSHLRERRLRIATDFSPTESLGNGAADVEDEEEDVLESLFLEQGLSPLGLGDSRDDMTFLPPPRAPTPPPGHGLRTPTGLSFEHDLPKYDDDAWLSLNEADSILRCPILRLLEFSDQFESFLRVRPDVKCNCLNPDSSPFYHYLTDRHKRVIKPENIPFEAKALLQTISREMVERDEGGYVYGEWYGTLHEMNARPEMEAMPPPAWTAPKPELALELQAGQNQPHGARLPEEASHPTRPAETDPKNEPLSPPPSWSSSIPFLIDDLIRDEQDQEDVTDEEDYDDYDEDDDDNDEHDEHNLNDETEDPDECRYWYHFLGREKSNGETMVCACSLDIDEHTLIYGRRENGEFVW